MELEGPLPRSQEPATRPCSEPINPALQSCVFSCLKTRNNCLSNSIFEISIFFDVTLLLNFMFVHLLNIQVRIIDKLIYFLQCDYVCICINELQYVERYNSFFEYVRGTEINKSVTLAKKLRAS